MIRLVVDKPARTQTTVSLDIPLVKRVKSWGKRHGYGVSVSASLLLRKGLEYDKIQRQKPQE